MLRMFRQKTPFNPNGWTVSALFMVGADVLKAVLRLVRGRLALSRLTVDAIKRRNARYAGASEPSTAADRLLVERVAFIMPRVAYHCPFRSDCLIQAMAGQAWLGANGLGSRIVVGIDKAEGGKLMSHAWLECAGATILGGDEPGDFVPVISGDEARNDAVPEGVDKVKCSPEQGRDKA